jgi:chloride channel protein, CIC family
MTIALERFRLPRAGLSETQRFLVISILIGIFAGLLVVCFHIAIDFVSWYWLGAPAGRLRYGRMVSPTLGALAAVFLVTRVFPAARGSGVNQTKAAIYISDGYVPGRAIAGKFLACSVSIGSGNSLGPEDPSLHMGAGVASVLGRAFRLGRDNMRMIAPVGGAAGIAAAFNTPITAVLFVMEEVIAAWSAAVLGSILLTAVSAVVVVRWFLGDQPLFRVPMFELTHPSELAVYAAIGVAGGLLSAGFVKLIEVARARLERLPARSIWMQAGGAGLAVGVVGLWFPEVMGAGYEAIDNALHGRFDWPMLVQLGLLKMAVTALCFSARVPGGMFAPTLFIGAMIGGGLGGLAQCFWPFPTSPAESYVLVGMGTFFAGVFRAPMTSIFMVFEVSASYVIILPVIVANIVSWFVSQQLHPTPFFTMLARQEGVDLPSAEEYRSSRPLRVEDAIPKEPPLVLDAANTVREALAATEAAGVLAALVRTADGGWSSVTREWLEGAELPDATLADAAALPPCPRIYPDMPVDSALRLLGAYPLLPVASRTDPGRLIGAVSLGDVHRAYGLK